MAKQTFTCVSCAHVSPRWFGRCPACGEWGTAADAPAPSRGLETKRLGEVRSDDPRLLTGLSDVDRVLGGGLVPGSVVLLAGEPGIGKSTLLLQMVAGLALRPARTLLVTGEESLAQVARRATRMGLATDEVEAAATSSLRHMLQAVETDRPDVLIVDSIQTVADEDVSGAPGSVGQVRGCAAALCRMAKSTGTAVVLVGHVTKDGQVAGPKTLEHMVDAVVTLEGDRSGSLRLLRVAKNRYGSCEETAVLSMGASGLDPVPDPSSVLLADRAPGAAGSAVFPTCEGSRAMLLEVQALVTPSQVSRRVAIGVDQRRLSMLLGVLTQHANVAFDNQDVFLAVTGGLALRDPSADLAACLAIASAQRNVGLDASMVAFGEIGLGGEVRRVPGTSRRLNEALRLGFGRAIVPRGSPVVQGLEIHEIATVRDALILVQQARIEAA